MVNVMLKIGRILLFTIIKEGTVMNEVKFGFFFGAGAESCYNLPSGADFTLDTICRKRTELYNQLEVFYQNREFITYSKPYTKKFHFQSNSHGFSEIVHRAAKNSNSEIKYITRLIELFERIEKNEGSNKNSKEDIRADKDELKERIEKIYKVVILDIDADKNNVNGEREIEQYQELLDNFSYYGTMETLFSTIANPAKTNNNFWKLINYFWSCYMAIMIPLLENSLSDERLELFNQNKYKYILDDLQGTIDYIYSENSDDFIQGYRTNNTIYNYYKELEKLQPCCVLTTNYTPFIKQFTKTEPIFLAGELCDFEAPDEFIIDQFKNIGDKKLVFPYMLTQAPIKPIIHPRQLENYAKALNHLKEIDVLVILGYGLNDNDDHINAMLHDFLCAQQKHIIYCQYSTESNNNRKNTHTQILKKLRVEDLQCQSRLKIFFISDDILTDNFLDNLLDQIKEVQNG